MRSLTVVCLLAGTAVADESPRPMQPVSVGFAVIGMGGKLAGLDASGWGGNLELAIGRGRWQYFGEGSLSRVELDPKMAKLPGWQVRGGVGVRWHARAFELAKEGSIDMYLEGFAGWSRYDVSDRAIARPDLGVGVAYGVRTFFGRDLRDRGMRISARVFFAPARADEIVCRGSMCPTSDDRTTSGLMAVFGGYL